jgi:hypothetical protein
MLDKQPYGCVCDFRRHVRHPDPDHRLQEVKSRPIASGGTGRGRGLPLSALDRGVSVLYIEKNCDAEPMAEPKMLQRACHAAKLRFV